MRQFLFVLIALLFALGVWGYELPIGVQRMFDYQLTLAQSLSFAVAVLAGIITFASPCGFVVLPMFFSYLFSERRQAVQMTIMFSLGLIAAFVLFGVIAGFAGEVFNPYKEYAAVISGILLIALGVMSALNVGFSFFSHQARPTRHTSHTGMFALGALFAVGWTPCVGPVLGGIFILSANAASLGQSMLLFAGYALGVAIPLVSAAYLSDRFDVAKFMTGRALHARVLGHSVYTTTYNLISGVILVIVGVIMVTGKGTGFFMNTIPQYVPWTMEWFVAANDVLLQSAVLRSPVVLVPLLVVLCAGVVFAIRRSQ
ncbi:cytochrome c biogenesis protein CcdA [Candidatus Woesearchaeota archaeon]|nr:cytochrome c biogenesis protein CcdA [Candidatus Woesearchaeota archaeon]